MRNETVVVRLTPDEARYLTTDHIEETVREKAYAVLVEGDYGEPPPTKGEQEWAEGLAKRIASHVAMGWDDYVSDQLDTPATTGGET